MVNESKPAHVAAKLDAADEINHHADVFFADLVQKRVLKIKLRFVHVRCGVPFFRQARMASKISSASCAADLPSAMIQ